MEESINKSKERLILVIEADMEGATLVDSMGMMFRAPDGSFKEDYEFACDRLANDLNAAILGAFDAGADEVRFEDGHGGGGNIKDRHRDPAKYPGIARARQVSLNDEASLDGATAYIQLNMHAMAGTANAFLDHTQSSATWHNLWIGGKRCVISLEQQQQRAGMILISLPLCRYGKRGHCTDFFTLRGAILIVYSQFFLCFQGLYRLF